MDLNTRVSRRDCGFYDEGGRVHYIDRLKDAIKCLGFHVPTAELEQLISSLDEVREAAVVGLPSSEFQDAPVAFVVPTTSSEGCAGLAHKIKQHVAGEETFITTFAYCHHRSTAS
ncbi:hypothetical protein HPB48_020044 [Haemaphysalis longicornis]|uniref:AMP-binding enzyme C-terminal domain-containing protein n=1 Tax=Haemaphysalis longicornis TaxID=44386 RepID=A0A9J6GYX4_HAELO|nr:hypothetical protein HPB48_020044 [Haemaphysalis longicornis]